MPELDLPPRPYHDWPSTTDVNYPAKYDRCRRCGVERFSDDPDMRERAAAACPNPRTPL